MGTNEAPRPVWTYWKNMAHVTVHEAVALSLDVDPRWNPRSVQRDAYITSRQVGGVLGKIRARETVAENHARNDTLPCEKNKYLYEPDSYVTLGDFRAWGEALPEPFTFPPEFPEAAPEQTDLHGWPWGTYETELLRKLAAAANRYWVNYDPDEPDTAPTNEAVAEWLRSEQGVSTRVAEVMAQILRADGLRTGPRPLNCPRP